MFCCILNAVKLYKAMITLSEHIAFRHKLHISRPGAIQVLRNADGVGGGCQIFSEKKRYEGVMFNVISVTRGWVGVQFAEK